MQSCREQEQQQLAAASSAVDSQWSEESFLITVTEQQHPDWDLTALAHFDLSFFDLPTTTTGLLDTHSLPETAVGMMEPAALQSIIDGTEYFDGEDTVSTTNDSPTQNYHSDHSMPPSTQTSPDFLLFPPPGLRKAESSETSYSKTSTTRHSPSSTGGEEISSGKVCKRQRNTEAARRYRQRKLDRVTELEEALAAMGKERDELKLKLARSEAEADILRSLHKKG